MFRDSSELLFRAIEYLEKARGESRLEATHLIEPLVRETINKHVLAFGSLMKVAKRLKCSRQYLHGVLQGQHPISDKFLRKLGLKRVILIRERDK